MGCGKGRWAILMWIIHDYPKYGLVVGYVHQGYKACAICGPDLALHDSQELNKVIYEGFRHWLPSNHPYRKNHNHIHFNGKEEHMLKPQPKITINTLKKVAEYEAWVGAKHMLGSRGDPSKFIGIKRRNALYNLPYF
jgi:hypothetical protein